MSPCGEPFQQRYCVCRPYSPVLYNMFTDADLTHASSSRCSAASSFRRSSRLGRSKNKNSALWRSEFCGVWAETQARSQPQNSKGAPATSKGAHNLHPKKVVTKSPSQPITEGVWGSAVSSPAGSGAEPQPLTILVHSGLKWKLLVQ